MTMPMRMISNFDGDIMVMSGLRRALTIDDLLNCAAHPASPSPIASSPYR